MRHNEVKSLLTKFLYKNEHLHFQILISNGESSDVYGEYMDYNEYKETFDMLQRSFLERDRFRSPLDKGRKSSEIYSKVA